MKKVSWGLMVAAGILLAGCESARYVKSELSGTSRPEGGIEETVAPSKTYGVTPQALRRAVLDVLEEQGYVFEENPSTGTVKTEPKLLTDTKRFRFTGATYSAKLFVRLDGSTVTYRAKFDKSSNLTMPEQNVEYPEKENELRKSFFDALDAKVVTASPSRAAKAASPVPNEMAKPAARTKGKN